VGPPLRGAGGDRVLNRDRLDPLGVAFVITAAAGFGTLGPLARFAADLGFTPVALALWRALVAVIVLVGVLAVGVRLGRVPSTRVSTIPRSEWVQLMAMGVFVAGTTLSLFFAFERTTIATVLIVFYTFPVWVAIAAVPVFGEHLSGRKLAAIATSGAGLVLLLAGHADGGPGGVDLMGIGLALVASLCQTGFALVGAGGFSSVPALQSAALLRLFSVAIYGFLLLPLLVALGQGATVVDPIGSAEAWLIILAVGITGAAIPAVLIIAGYRRVGPTRGAVLMLVEPVVGALLAMLLLSEQPTAVQVAGGVLVLVGAASVQLVPVARPSAETRPAAE
jgi:drug/metabolite transporter (DMT)-like permease